jgi:hypothetical protein
MNSDESRSTLNKELYPFKITTEWTHTRAEGAIQSLKTTIFLCKNYGLFVQKLRSGLLVPS